MKRFLLLGIGLLLSGNVMAGPVKLLAFQANGLGIFPETGDKHYTGQVAWIPGVDLGGLGVRGELGIAPYKNAFGSTIWQLNYEAFLTLPLVPGVFSLEGGGGLATASGSGASLTKPILSIYAVVGLPVLLNRAYFAYSRHFISGNAANHFKIGLGFSL